MFAEGLVLGNRNSRVSRRSKKYSRGMKYFDEETRRQVRESRIEALEETNIFSASQAQPIVEEADYMLDSDAEDIFLDKKKKKAAETKPSRKKGKKEGGIKVKGRPKINLHRILSLEFYEEDDKNFPNYLSMAAAPSRYPPRNFCSVCGFDSKYKCVRCGMKYCSLKCHNIHMETTCIRFGD